MAMMLGSDTPLIAIEDLDVRRDTTTVLDGVSLQLAPGERLAVAGQNGAGKTTLLRAIIGLQPTVSGRVRLLGRTCAREEDFRRARPQIGFLFQDSDDQLFYPTVIEDVAFGPMNQGLNASDARAKALATLQRLDLAHLAERITYRLSGGEKRLACLAGLLAMEPRVLLLDEPTNGLDAANAARLTGILQNLDSAMIIVSHDVGFLVEVATRAVILRNGRIVEGLMHRHPHAHDHVHIHPVDEAHDR
jgi:cobalt/nickel transport system ATP-binding protein